MADTPRKWFSVAATLETVPWRQLAVVLADSLRGMSECVSVIGSA